jgi:hypothetical protein
MMGCCDPEDCGPCCPECPSCPRVDGTPPFIRRVLRVAMEHTAYRVWLTTMWGSPIPVDVPEMHLPQMPVEPPVDFHSLLLGAPLPWVRGDLR